MKRILTLMLAALMLLALPAAASTTDIQQVIEITVVDETLTFTSKMPTTFWEVPDLRPGETTVASGELVVINTTDSVQNITFQSVELPYDDPAALEYLNHLTLTLKKGDAILYEGPYSAINGTNRPDVAVSLNIGESVSYTIDLYCDFTYTGTDYVGDAILDWKFSTQAMSSDDPPEEEPDAEPIDDPMVTQWFLAGIATIILFAALVIYRRRIRK